MGFVADRVLAKKLREVIVDRLFVLLLELRALVPRQRVDDRLRESVLARDTGVRIEDVIAIPLARGDDDREFAQPQREAALQPQDFSQRMHALGDLRAVQRETIRPRNSSAAAAEKLVEDTFLFVIEFAVERQQGNTRHGYLPFDLRCELGMATYFEC